MLYQSGFQTTQFANRTLTLRKRKRSVGVLADEENRGLGEMPKPEVVWTVLSKP